MQEDRKVEVVGRYAAQLSLIELVLGSFLHGLHIPFSGSFLSLNQGYFLCGAALEEPTAPARRVQEISQVAAVLKSLSPAGKKLGPMLSLSMQGTLFYFGISLFGVNPVGLSIAMVLLALWTFLQPVITYYLFFGNELFASIQYLYEKTLPFHGISAKYLLFTLIAAVVAKLILALGVAQLSIFKRGSLRWEERLLKMAQSKKIEPRRPVNLARGIWLDLTSPLFLISLGITAFYLYFSEHSAEFKLWLFMRPVAVAFVFFYFSRTLTLERWLGKLKCTRFENFARSCEVALQEVRKVIPSPTSTP